jgi:hypothetical protein
VQRVAEPLVVSSWELPLRYYGDLGLRQVAATHLLTRPEDVSASAAALADDGWRGPQHPSDAFLRSKHSALYGRSNGDLCVLYWRLFHEFSDADHGREAQDLWESTIELDLRGLCARALNPADELLNILVSGARPRMPTSVIWIADALAVLRAADAELAWERVVEQAKRLHAAQRAGEAARFLQRELGAPIPADVIDELRQTPTTRRERLAHRASAGRLGMLGRTPETVTRFLRLTADRSILRALAELPTFLRDEWGLERRSQTPTVAIRKTAARLAGPARRAGRRRRR